MDAVRTEDKKKKIRQGREVEEDSDRGLTDEVGL